MLGKLIKYEFKATGRTLLPLYGAVILFAFINKMFLGDFFINGETFLGEIPQAIGMMVYVTTLIATFFVTLFIIIQRYRTNLLGDEGYLMNTIPVKSWQNITSKLIVSCVWSVLSFVCAIVSIIILAYQKGLIKDIITGMPEFFQVLFSYVGANEVIVIIEIISIMIIGGISGILIIYASLSIGNIFPKRKMLASLGAFIVLNMASNTLASFIQFPIMMIFSKGKELQVADIQIMLGMTAGLVLLLSVVYFVISNYILKRKLNLE